MLTNSEVKSYAHLRRLRILDHIWKDYLQDMILHIIYTEKPNMVFRGGTCIWKLYNGDRFSEDVDLCVETIPEGLEEHITKELVFLGFIPVIERRKRTANMLFTRFTISSPAHPQPTTIIIEILESQECAKKGSPATIYSPYPDIPPIDVLASNLDILAADKVSAIFGRDKPRDIHDLYILLKQGAKMDIETIAKQIPGFTIESFKQRMEEKSREWKKLEPLLVSRLPPLKEEVSFITRCFEKQT